MKRALTRGLVALGGLLAAVTVTAGEVSAHATLESADPANGSMLVTPPDHVALVFSESVAKPAALAVLDSSGNELEGGELRSEEHTSELQSQSNLVCRLLLEKKKKKQKKKRQS